MFLTLELFVSSVLRGFIRRLPCSLPFSLEALVYTGLSGYFIYPVASTMMYFELRLTDRALIIYGGWLEME